MIQEVPTFPLITLSASQGKIGTRKWILDPTDDIDNFVRRACKSHWPKDPNTVPIQIQVGALDDRLRIDSTDSDPFGILPQLGKILVVVQYQFLLIHNCWPVAIPTPAHPVGTAMSLEVRGSGQFLFVNPIGFRAVGAPGVSTSTFNYHDNCRIIVPLTEFHITCDRMTRADVDGAMHVPWRDREGYVNQDTFLNEARECLLFDGWNMRETFAPDVDDPVRYRLTAVLRSRRIWAASHDPTEGTGAALGWNHDYRVFTDASGAVRGGWMGIRLLDNVGGGGKMQKRYPTREFAHMFCNKPGQQCITCSQPAQIGIGYPPPGGSGSG